MTTSWDTACKWSTQTAQEQIASNPTIPQMRPCQVWNVLLSSALNPSVGCWKQSWRKPAASGWRCLQPMTAPTTAGNMWVLTLPAHGSKNSSPTSASPPTSPASYQGFVHGWEVSQDLPISPKSPLTPRSAPRSPPPEKKHRGRQVRAWDEGGHTKAVRKTWLWVGEFTTHFRTYFSGDWDVHWGYGILSHGHMRDLKEMLFLWRTELRMPKRWPHMGSEDVASVFAWISDASWACPSKVTVPMKVGKEAAHLWRTSKHRSEERNPRDGKHLARQVKKCCAQNAKLFFATVGQLCVAWGEKKPYLKTRGGKKTPVRVGTPGCHYVCLLGHLGGLRRESDASVTKGSRPGTSLVLFLGCFLLPCYKFNFSGLMENPLAGKKLKS